MTASETKQAFNFDRDQDRNAAGAAVVVTIATSRTRPVAAVDERPLWSVQSI